MFIATVPNRNSPPATLLRESYRQGGQVKSRTLANLSKLPPDAIQALRLVLKGQTLVPSGQALQIVASRHHGHVQAVMLAMQRLGFPLLLAARSSPERDLAQALVAARLLRPASKLATTRWWGITTLPAQLRVAGATEDDLYGAMDWLLERQPAIERKLAARHLEQGGLALYDLTSSYFEGVACPLATQGHDRDGKKGKLQVNWGLLTDRRGRPVAVSVFKGNTSDSKTLLPQVERAQSQFGIRELVMVGDRGMITGKQIETLRDKEGLEWITALRPEAIRQLVREGALQLGLFDERNLFELIHPDYPGERLVACRNPVLAARRARKRRSLIEATERELSRVRQMVEGGRVRGQEQIRQRLTAILRSYAVGKHYRLQVWEDGFDFQVDEAAAAAALAHPDPRRVREREARQQRHRAAIEARFQKLRRRIEGGRLRGKDKIGVRVGKVIDKYKVGKHFQLEIEDNRLSFAVDQEKVAAEAALDGIYVVRTAVAPEQLSAEDSVRGYKLLGQVERAIGCMKTVHLQVRPIRHHLEDRVRAHIFLCALAYYVQWHMLEAWRPLLFGDEDQQAKLTRDPVAPAQRSEAALRKVHTKTLPDGSEVHSFRTLLDLLSDIVLNVCRIPGMGTDVPTFEIVTTPDAKQQQALDLLQSITL